MSEPTASRRDEILAAARSAFFHYGFRRVSLDAIATEVGVTRTAIYHHFPTKEALLRAVVEGLHDAALERAKQAAASEGPLAERIYAILDAKKGWFYEHVHGSPHGAEIADASNRSNGDLLERATRRYLGVLSLVLAEAENAGELDLAARGLNPELAAGYLALSADGLAGPSGHPPPPKQYRQRLHTLARISVAGFGGPAVSP
jgi:AcrR family transcriptional regulator